MYHGWEQSTLEKYLTAEACGEPLKVKVGGGNWTHINDFWPRLWGPATLFYNRSKVYGIKISQPLRTYAYSFIKKEKKCSNWSQTDKTGWKTKHLIRKKQKQKPTTLNWSVLSPRCDVGCCLSGTPALILDGKCKSDASLHQYSHNQGEDWWCTTGVDTVSICCNEQKSRQCNLQ